MGLQALAHLLYPPQCLACGVRVQGDFGLCVDCWRQTPFIHGAVCNSCGIPILGEDEEEIAQCDACLRQSPPWSAARAALVYEGTARDLVLRLKNGDRTDLARPAGDWMVRAARPILREGMIVAPIPLHWLRLVKRRYNQAALLSARVAKGAGLEHCPDLLIRRRNTGSQKGRDGAARHANLAGALGLHPRRASRVEGRHVLLIDDVLTSGATMTAAAEACLEGGAVGISVLVMARVAKEA